MPHFLVEYFDYILEFDDCMPVDFGYQSIYQGGRLLCDDAMQLWPSCMEWVGLMGMQLHTSTTAIIATIMHETMLEQPVVADSHKVQGRVDLQGL